MMLLNEVLLAEKSTAWFQSDPVIFGVLMGVLALVFYTSKKEGGWSKFYKIIPALFLCYFIPAILSTFGIIEDADESLYKMAKNYLLPASLILMTLSIDLPAIFKLGPKALIMFATATIGIIIGGPLAIIIMKNISPETVGGEGFDATWRGLATLAGSWIGGGANQTAMLELYKFNQDLYGGMVTVDIVVANVLMAGLLLGIGKRAKIDQWLKADNTAIDQLVERMENFEKSVEKTATTTDYIKILGLAFVGVGLSHFLGGILAEYFKLTLENPKESTLTSSFFWLVLISTFFGFAMSFTKARNLEGAGASKIGSIFIYILVVTIGMKVDIMRVLENPLLIFVGAIWC